MTMMMMTIMVCITPFHYHSMMFPLGYTLGTSLSKHSLLSYSTAVPGPLASAHAYTYTRARSEALKDGLGARPCTAVTRCATWLRCLLSAHVRHNKRMEGSWWRLAPLMQEVLTTARLLLLLGSAADGSHLGPVLLGLLQFVHLHFLGFRCMWKQGELEALTLLKGSYYILTRCERD